MSNAFRLFNGSNIFVVPEVAGGWQVPRQKNAREAAGIVFKLIGVMALLPGTFLAGRAG
ncbi:hypothetical protein IAI51_10075 [Pseudomonas sp. N40(2020)]|uniref:hypothetical protein n=1 Tax=Pseudomonas sp. N40(2020) TaxID=2767798 RepID=UPI00165728AE|nr:hypothetical protein [Pseudomonas sp. N40(2020)]MBC8996871.1 hypothetical protein [Pseudomonas sp. N40(2020)]